MLNVPGVLDSCASLRWDLLQDLIGLMFCHSQKASCSQPPHFRHNPFGSEHQSWRGLLFTSLSGAIKTIGCQFQHSAHSGLAWVSKMKQNDLPPWASQQCAQECPQTGGRPERHTSGPWSDMAGVLEYPSATICLDWRAVFSWMGVILRPCLTCISPHVTASGHPEIMSLQQEVFRRLCHPHARSQRILIVAANT